MMDLLGRSELVRRLAGGGAAGFGSRLGKAALSVIAAAYLARVLPPSAFGVYLLGQTLALFGAVVAVLGLENTLVREVAGFVARGMWEAVPGTLRRARGLVLLGAAGVGVALLTGHGALLRCLFHEPELGAISGWIALWSALEALSKTQVAALRGEHRLVPAAALDGFVQAAVFLATVVWMAVSGTVDLQRVFAAGAVSSGSSAAAGGWLLARGRGTTPVDRSAGPLGGLTAATLWHRSWPLLGATILGASVNQGDLWLVGIVAAGEGAALYGSALKLTLLVALPLFVLNRTLGSTLAELHLRGRTRELETLLRGTTTLVAGVTGLVVLGLLLFGERVLALVFGEFYAAATPILVLLVVGQLVAVATGPCGTMLMMAGHERLQLAVSGVSGAYLLLGSLWAGAHYGVMGVAVVSASSTGLNNLVTLVLARRRVGVWTHAYVSPVGVREGLSRMAGLAKGYAS